MSEAQTPRKIPYRPRPRYAGPLTGAGLRFGEVREDVFQARLLPEAGGCLRWQGAYTEELPIVSFADGGGGKSTTVSARRVAWRLAHGTWPGGPLRMTCGHAWCLQVAHMQVLGETAGELLPEAALREAVALVAQGWSQREAAQRMGFSRSHLQAVLAGDRRAGCLDEPRASGEPLGVDVGVDPR